MTGDPIDIMEMIYDFYLDKQIENLSNDPDNFI